MQGTMRRIFLVASMALASMAGAQDGESDAGSEVDDVLSSGTERCVSLSRIRRTDIIDDETIVFYLRGGDIFINSLPRTCPGLERNDRFMYEVNQTRLCSTDWITVIEGFGVSRQRGFTCRLGEFSPITEEALAVMMDATIDDGPDESSVEMKTIELPDPEAESAAEESEQ